MINAQLYRYEADRLRSIALGFEVADIREAFLDIARQYETLADKIETALNKPEVAET